MKPRIRQQEGERVVTGKKRAGLSKPLAAFPENIGEMIRVGRDLMGWTREELAKQTPFSFETIKNLETGKSRRPKTIRMVVDALNAALEEADEPTVLASGRSKID